MKNPKGHLSGPSIHNPDLGMQIGDIPSAEAVENIRNKVGKDRSGEMVFPDKQKFLDQFAHQYGWFQLDLERSKTNTSTPEQYRDYFKDLTRTADRLSDLLYAMDMEASFKLSDAGMYRKPAGRGLLNLDSTRTIYDREAPARLLASIRELHQSSSDVLDNLKGKGKGRSRAYTAPLSLLIHYMGVVFMECTGKEPAVTYDFYSEKYTGSFYRLIEAVIPYEKTFDSADITNNTIGKAIQNRQKSSTN